MESAPVLEPIESASPEGAFPLSDPGRWILAILSLGGAAIHLVMVPAHAGEWLPEGVAFALAGWFSLVFALAVVARPSRRWLELGIAANLVFIAAWGVTRVIGMPFGPDSGTKELAGLVDLTCVGLEAALVLACAVFLAKPRLGENLDAGALVVASIVPLGVIALVTAVVASPNARSHSHGGGDDHAQVTAAGGDHHAGDHDMAAMDHDSTAAVPAGMATPDPKEHAHETAVAVPYDPTKPLDFGGVPGVTPEQQARAENLVAVTLNKLPQWADYKYAEAHGFHSIGDGPTGTEHFVNYEYMEDHIFLDPDKPESLVYDTKRDGTKTLSAAMYMVDRGTPLTAVPDIGGKLTQWHIHNNLCYRPDGKLGGLTDAAGKCAPGLILPEPTPMIHVWIRKHPCGPFAALEGIGGGTIAEGETKLCDSAHGSH